MAEPPDPALAAALVLYRDRDFTAAAAAFAAILAGAPQNADALRLHGLALVRAGQARRALPFLARARRLAWTDPLAHLHHGIGLLEAGEPARAAAVLRRAATLAPDDAAVWINFAAALLALDRPQAARAAARRAVNLAPESSEAQYTLGLAQAACGDAARAAAAFEQAIARRRDFADAWVNLGLARYRQGAVQPAMAAMRSALAVAPLHGAAEANLAAFLLLVGETEAALDRLRAVLARDPACVPARLNLANAMLLERTPAEALALLDGPPPPGQEGRYWQAHHVLALIQLGRWEEARTTLDAIAPPYGAAEPLVVARRMALAAHDGDAAGADRFAARLATIVTNEAVMPEHRIIADFDLARFERRRGRLGAAFAHWTRAHRLLARFQPFSRAGHRAFVDACIARFDAARLRDGPLAANTDPAPVFVVGMPRSGTTLCEQILSAHRDVFGAGERGALHHLAARLAGNVETAAAPEALAALDAATLDREAETYLADLHALAPEALRIVDKMPANARHLGFIACLLPGARIISCRRDPRDIGLSIFQLRFFGHHPYAHDLGDLGFAIAEHQRLMAHWRAVLPGRILDVDLADWIEDFDATLARVLDFLGLPPDPACARFHEQTRRVRTASAHQVRRPINRSGLGRFRAYAAQLEPLFAELDRAGLMPPDPADARLRATGLRAARRPAAAARVLAAAVAANPGDAPLLADLALARLEAGEHDAARAAAEQAVAAAPSDPAIHRTLCNVLAYCPDVSGAALSDVLRRCGALWPRGAAAEPPAARPPGAKLRLGLLGLFHAGPVTTLTHAAIAALDRAAFAIVCFSVGRTADAVTDAWRALGAFHDVSSLDDAALAAHIRAAAVDVLIDLTGYLRGGRMQVLARRPAPVQIKWAGAQYHTSGIAEVDWIITDARQTPPALAPLYTENLLLMPHGYACWTPPEAAPDPPPPPPMLHRDCVTYGSCNSLMKMTPTVLAAWAAIVAAVPGSHLLLAAPAFDEAETADRVRGVFAASGIATGRIDLRGTMPRAEVLATWAQIDIGLMPFPYGGGVSLLEALWMGVPAVVLSGETFAARHGVSHLGVLGLDDWVTDARQSYVDRAVAAAGDPTVLSDLRANLRTRLSDSTLCDAAGFAAALGEALRSTVHR
jgi:predicted O-linked N-acetylglucosamine transferase (SPINDLY family)